MKYSPMEKVREFLWIRETGENKGIDIQGFQRYAGGQPGDSWCCEFATTILRWCFEGNSPIPLLIACQDVYNLAKKNNWLTETPVNDDIVLYVNDQDHAHHIGFYEDGNIGAGNTSADGTSSNGDRVAIHKITSSGVKFVHYPR